MKKQSKTIPFPTSFRLTQGQTISWRDFKADFLREYRGTSALYSFGPQMTWESILERLFVQLCK
ncbi:MAG: hypothetical protein OJI67_13260, partial [Prosthecobacter sp.]|nr:hypothetical protein [Prosthecobacter sp.]